MRIGDPKEAAKLGMQAATQAKTIHYQRIRDELQVLSRASIKRLAIPEVNGLYSVLTDDFEMSAVSK